MANESPLQHLIELAKRRRDRRLQQAGEAQRLLMQARATLEALEQFRAERLGKRRALAGVAAQSVASQVIESRFDIKLVTAVKAQGERTEQADGLHDERLQTARQAQNRLAALELLARRRAQRARDKADRSEQQATDELVASARFRSEPPAR